MPSRTFLPLVSLVSLLGCGSHSTAVTRTPQTKTPLPFHAAAITLEEHNARAADPAKFCSGFHAAATTLEEYVRHFLLGMYRTWGDSTQFGGEGRVLANGVRFSQAEGYARDVTCGMLFGGVRLPSRLGSGFLFWDQDGLWKSDTFTGPLTFVDSYESGEMPGEIRRVSVGSSFLLFHGGGWKSGRSAWSPKEGWSPKLPHAGLIDMVELDSGLSAMLVDPGLLFVRAVGSKDYVPLEPPPTPIDAMTIEGVQVVLRTEGGPSYTVTEAGALVEVPSPKIVSRRITKSIPRDFERANWPDDKRLPKELKFVLPRKWEPRVRLEVRCVTKPPVPPSWHSPHRDWPLPYSFWGRALTGVTEGTNRLSGASPSRRRKLDFQFPFSTETREVSITSIFYSDYGGDDWGTALPVLSPSKGMPRDVLMLEGKVKHSFGVWIPDRESPIRVDPRLRSEEESVHVTSAVRDGEGRLVALTELPGRTQLRQLHPKASVLLELPVPRSMPPYLTLVGLASDGLPALLRLWSPGEPTASDPILASTLDGKVTPLAPMSTLVPGPCDDPDAYRAILSVPGQRIWLSIEVEQEFRDNDALALLSLSPSRICVEALDFRFRSGNIHRAVVDFSSPERSVGYHEPNEPAWPLQCSIVRARTEDAPL